MQGKLEQVSAVACDEDYNQLVIGDTSGHLRVWDISAGINVNSMEACRKSFKEVCEGGCSRLGKPASRMLGGYGGYFLYAVSREAYLLSRVRWSGSQVVR
jgi:hypothetical protein